MVGHIQSGMPQLPCSYSALEASNYTLLVYYNTWLHCKMYPPNRGCVICDKTTCLSDECV